MLETNIRVVDPGPDLSLSVRVASVSGPDLSPDLLQRACGTLRRRFGLAAVVRPGNPPTLLVATERPVQPIHLKEEEWELHVTDAGGPTQRLALVDPDGPVFLPPLIERAVLAQVARQGQFWTLDSPRIWYEPRPFRVEEGIAAYRRYEIATLPIDGVGVGIAVDIGTAFFSVESLAYFFAPDLPPAERKRRLAHFESLTTRQEGQKGTLLYDNGRSQTKCYFELAPEGITCATTGTVRVKGQSYDSLLAYYRSEYPALEVAPGDPAVRVSFPGIERTQWVAAKLVRVRVMNDDMPERLGSVDKIKPAERREMIQGLWARLGARPLSGVALELQAGFWRPDESRVVQLPLADLVFGKRERLPAPAVPSVDAYRNHYRQRSVYLARAGCYSVPPTMSRTLYCAYPKHLPEVVSRQLATDLTAVTSAWSRVSVSANLIGYDSVAEAVEKLKAAERAGTVLFILNEEPAAYYEAAFQLSGWRVKRITERTLREQYRYLTEGAWNRRTNSRDLGLGKRRWESFISPNALDVLQLFDAVPFRIDRAGPYEAQLVLDVGHDRRQLALSLLVARDEGKSPSFRVVTHVHTKSDPQHEKINGTILADQVVRIIEAALSRRADPLGSLLVLRDGQIDEQEIAGIDQAAARLVARGKLRTDVRVDLAEVRKDTQKSVRVWEVDKADSVDNPLEGSLIRFSDKVVLVASTGAATLHQGTAEPFLVTGDGRCPSLLDAARAAFDGAQLNWSSPGVAQRLTLPLKRGDDELAARAAQEIRRLR